MRKHFAAYYRPSPDDFRVLHAGIVSLDANVLLNLYRYSPETRDEFLALLAKLRPQLWLTHQAAAEFHRSRLRVIAQQLGMLAEARGRLQAAKADLDPKLVDVYRAPSQQSKSRQDKLNGAWRALDAYIRDLESEAVKPTSDPTDDGVWSQLTDLFDGRVGEPFTADDRQRLEAEGKERYSRHVPPGYADEEKGRTQYGDWLIWRQLLDHAKSAGMPIVLVTDDRKDDWWLRAGNRPVAPRPELIEEMAAEADQPFYMYQPDQFLKDVGKAVKQVASGRAIKEVASLPPITVGGREYLPSRVRALRHRTEELRRQLAAVTEALQSPPGDAASRRRQARLLDMQARLEAGIAATEGEQRGLLVGHVAGFYGSSPILSGGSNAVLAPGSPYLSKDIVADLRHGYTVHLGSVDGLAPDQAFNITYPRHLAPEWLREFDIGPGEAALDEDDLPGTPNSEDEPSGT